MKYAVAGLAGTVVLLGIFSPTLAADGTVSVMLGTREPLDNWLQNSDTDRYSTFGVRADFGPDDAALKATVGLNLSLGDERIGDGIFSPSPDLNGLEKAAFRDFVAGLDTKQDDELVAIFDNPADLASLAKLSEEQIGQFVALDSFKASMLEISAGFLLRPTGEKKVLPFFGGGLSQVVVDAEAMVVEQAGPNSSVKILRKRSETERSSGIFLNGGVMWRIQKQLTLGVQLRLLSETNLEFKKLGLEGNADYAELGVIFGYDW